MPAARARCGLLAVALAGLSLALSGCTLIDQRTFGAPPPPRPVPVLGAIAPAAAALPVDPRVPLVRIAYATPDPVFRPMLDYAVHAAQARDPGVAFDVVAVMPGQGAPRQGAPAMAAATPALPAGAADAASVMRAIMAQGVAASRIHLSLATDPKVSTREVRVYVR
ncbi:MAG: hypothetical protein KGL12_07660 [Rhodospirillales bacterium]|nr:hypothetical protein [Rhodospirillales bacterium]